MVSVALILLHMLQLISRTRVHSSRSENGPKSPLPAERRNEMKRFTSAALVLGALMAIIPEGAFAQGFDRDRDDHRARIEVRHDYRDARGERARESREHVRRIHYDRCR